VGATWPGPRPDGPGPMASPASEGNRSCNDGLMGRATVWDVMVQTLGIRSARRVASFMECWAITERRWSDERAVDRFTHEWEMSAAEVSF
jgi:hypothetical protein